MSSESAANDRRALEKLWHESIPLAAAIQLSVAEFDGETLTTVAPAEPNRNPHGTAFAGSLYSICALTGWGWIWRFGHRLGIDGDIVLTRGEIDYRRPVTGRIECSASVATAAVTTFGEQIAQGRPGRCPVECVIHQAGAAAVRFSGVYHMRPAHCVASPV